MTFRFNRRKKSDLFVDTLRHMITAPVLTFQKLTPLSLPPSKQYSKAHPELCAILDLHIDSRLVLSPYKAKLDNSVLFLQMLGSQAQSLPSLISPHVVSQVPVASQLLAVAPSTAANKGQSISALPMGSRIELNPWTSQVDSLKSKPNALASSRKRQALLINPSILRLVRQTTAGPGQKDKPVPTDRSKQED